MSDGMPVLLNAGQVARRVGCKQPNVHKWIARHGIEPVAECPHPVGKLYDAERVAAVLERWAADEESRLADEKRRAAALANSAS